METCNMANSSTLYWETLKKCPSILVSNDLMQLIKDPEERKETSSPAVYAHLTTMDELLMHMKNYIVKHSLYDPKNPLKIVVHETELGSLLGKSEFSLLDVKDILKAFIFPVLEKNSSEVIYSISGKMCVAKKRKLDDGFEISAKIIKGMKRNDTSCDSDESIYYFQDNKTDFVKGSTSDLNLSEKDLIIDETISVDVEYEYETDYSDLSSESDSDIKEFVKSAVVTFFANPLDSDIEYLADRSDDETESERELSEEDKWHCSSCFTLNDAFIRHCAACWKIRVGWLCEGSEKKNGEEQSKSKWKVSARKKKILSKKHTKNKNSTSSKFSDLPHDEGEISNSPSSCKDNTEVFQSPSNTFKDDNNCIQTKLNKQLCLFCCAKPADSSFIHGKIGCKVTCFKCGKKLMKSNKQCPVCRRNIERIVYLFNS